jgi:myxalamid-type polyketide synthase MxaE and MxaD
MRAKVSGGWNLHYATIDEELDFFLLFSSAAVVFGNPGQSNHAAANSGLDGLAHYRRSRGLPALSINWSAWDEIGAALKSDVGKRAGQQGIMMIKPVQGLHALSQLMRSNKTQIVALPVNWLRWQEGQKHAQTPALLRSVITEALEATGNYSILDENLGTEAIAKEHAEESQDNSLQIYIRQLVAELLEVSEKELDDQTPLSEYGFDSLMTVDLRGRLIRDWNANFGVSDLFSNLTLGKLRQQIEYQIQAKKAAASAVNPTIDLLKNIDELSEDEIDILLNQRLTGQMTLS